MSGTEVTARDTETGETEKQTNVSTDERSLLIAFTYREGGTRG